VNSSSSAAAAAKVMSDDRKSEVRVKKLTDDFEFQHEDAGSECERESFNGLFLLQFLAIAWENNGKFNFDDEWMNAKKRMRKKKRELWWNCTKNIIRGFFLFPLSLSEPSIIHVVLLNRTLRILCALTVFCMLIPTLDYFYFYSTEMAAYEIDDSGICSHYPIYQVPCGGGEVSVIIHGWIFAIIQSNHPIVVHFRAYLTRKKSRTPRSSIA
jgi:hypothetical protein